VRYWDSSAVVPLIADEQASESVRRVYAGDPEVAVWWATQVECVSTLVRKERAGDLDPAALDAALGRLELLKAEWTEVEPSEAVRALSLRFLRVHPLRAADALQLAAATVIAEGLPFLTLDDGLAAAARREGFPVEGL